MSCIEGFCHSCGSHYYGWVLKSEQNQTCDKCGSPLEVIENGVVISNSFDPPEMMYQDSVLATLKHKSI